MKKIQAGLFGYGCVGRGLYQVLQSKKAAGLPIDLKKICVKDQQKARDITAPLLTFHKEDILENDEINLVIELISDADEAFELVKKAMENGKAVVSANKKMIAEHLVELVQLQKTFKTPFLYEASVCGSIPVIRLLDEQYGYDELYSIETIANGTCNYILTHLFAGPNSYEEVLAEAQIKGFAEADPYLDISGYDTKYKLAILLAHTFGAVIQPDEILHFGINNIKAEDIAFAKSKYGLYRLVGKSFVQDGQLVAFVLPQLVKADHDFYHVNLEFNAVRTQSLFADQQCLVGKGAGSFPTASAVLADIHDAVKFKTYNLNKINSWLKVPIANNYGVKAYFRFDHPKLLNELNAKRVIEKHDGYAIVEVTIEQLQGFGLSDRDDVFLALL